MKGPTASPGIRRGNRYPFIVDPNTDWVLGPVGSHEDNSRVDELGPGGDYFFLPARKNGTWLPILVGLTGISVADFANGTQFDKHPHEVELKQQWLDCTRFYALDTDGPGGPDKEFFCAPAVTKLFFFLLHNYSALGDVVTSVTLGLPLDVEQLPPLPIPKSPASGRVRP